MFTRKKRLSFIRRFLRRALLRRPSAAIVLTAALVMLLAASAQAAGAEENKPDLQPGPPPSFVPEDLRAKLVAQQPLVEAASEIRWAVERGNAGGFTGIALADDVVEVFWKGDPPDAIAEVIDSARQNARVRVIAAAYSFAELKTAADEIVEQLDPEGPVHSVRISEEWSGLIVAVEPAADGAAIPGARVPVEVVREERIHPVTRLRDFAPFWGGARIFNEGNRAQCTAGFGVKDANGTEWLLTAGHCGAVGHTVTNGDRSRYVGTVSYEKPNSDIMLIHSDAGGRIYVTDGPATPWSRPDSPLTNEYGLPVAGWDWAFDGEILCHSGSASGTICGLRNRGGVRVSDSFYDPDCRCRQWVDDQEWATRVDGGLAAAGGDSGGPVFTPYFSSRAGAWRAVAKGTITASAGPLGGGTHTELIYQDFGAAWQAWGLNPIWEP